MRELLEEMRMLVKPGHLKTAEHEAVDEQDHDDSSEFRVRSVMGHDNPIFKFTGRLVPGATLEQLKSLLESNREKFEGHSASLYHSNGVVSLNVQIRPNHREAFSNHYKRWYGRLLRSV